MRKISDQEAIKRLHPHLELLQIKGSGVNRFLVKCIDCKTEKYKNIYGITTRCKCDKMSLSKKPTEEAIKKLNPQFVFLYRNKKVFVCKCNVCGNNINKWLDTLHKPCRCLNKKDFNDIKQEFGKFGYVVTSETYNHANDKLSVKCPKGHDWKVKWGDFYTGYRCGVCNTRKNEKECIRLIEELTGKKFVKTKPDFLKIGKKQRLELDGYNEELKIAIEYNGEQHYRPVSLYGGEASFLDVKRRDRIKKRLCKKNGIKLIVVPYRIKDKRSFIKKRLGL